MDSSRPEGIHQPGERLKSGSGEQRQDPEDREAEDFRVRDAIELREEGVRYQDDDNQQRPRPRLAQQPCQAEQREQNGRDADFAGGLLREVIRGTLLFQWVRAEKGAILAGGDPAGETDLPVSAINAPNVAAQWQPEVEQQRE